MKAGRHEAIVIGGGHNGLVAAACMARAGRKVLVVERRPVLGGAAATEEIFRGFHANTGASEAGLFLSQIAVDLRLERHGLRMLEGPALATSLLPGGEALTLWRDPLRTQGEISRFSKADAEKYPAYLEWIRRATDTLRPAMTIPPPALPQYHPAELLPWLRLALRLRRLGGIDMMELLRTLPLPASDLLDEWFQSPQLKGALAASGIKGALLGPKAPGTAFLLLYHAQGAGKGGFRASRFVQGGVGALSAALASTARQYGAEIITGLGVNQIRVQDGRATGVILEDGQEVGAPLVLSSADPRTTFFDLVGAPNLEVRFVREVKNIRFRGSVARVILALDGIPRFKALESEDTKALSGHLLVCPDLETLERAADEAKYGRLPDRPALDALLPTVLDPSLAPPEKHLMTVDAHFVPYQLRDSNWDKARQILLKRVLEQLEEHAPGLSSLVRASRVLTPLDYEREYGLPDGDPYHGQMGLDQLAFMRPVSGWTRYRTPIQGLFLCGAGAHPGGGLTGAPGYNATREALRGKAS